MRFQIRMNATLGNIGRGLTLLELVAAITILLILAVIVLPRFGTASASAKSRGCEANRRNLEVAIAVADAQGLLARQLTVDDLVTDVVVSLR